jgi:FAD dependent monooxygenase
MRVEYACIFGISSALPNLPAGEQITCYNKGWSILSVVGKNGRLYWFLFYKLDRKYNYMTAPRVSTDDAVRCCSALAAEPFWQDITFGDVWGARETFNVTRLDEYVLTEWTYGNIICIGDSAHKVRANPLNHPPTPPLLQSFREVDPPSPPRPSSSMPRSSSG